jgi:hypothetical protein
MVKIRRWGLSALAVGLTILLMGSASGFPPGKDGPKKEPPPDKNGKELREAHDTLLHVGLLTKVGPKTPPDTMKLFDQAKGFYRQAVTAFNEGDSQKAKEMGLAAKDAGRGLEHVLRANLPPGDLPPPPEGDGLDPRRKGEPPPPPDKGRSAQTWEPARAALDRLKDRLDEVGAGGGAGKAFTDASRRVYGLARQAYLDRDYPRAAALARGAEAWTHVSEHLERAGLSASLGAEPPPPGAPGRPGPRGEGPPPPPPPLEGPSQADRVAERQAPPPPPPLEGLGGPGR